MSFDKSKLEDDSGYANALSFFSAFFPHSFTHAA
jgi:hypothetical protein